MDQPSSTNRRRSALIALALLLLIVGLGWLTWVTGPTPTTLPKPSPTPTPKTFTPPPPPSPSPSPTLPTGVTEIVQLPAEFEGFAGPGDQVGEVMEGDWWGYPLIVPIIDKQDGYLHVRLPWRPNESTTWVKQGDLEITTTPYRIEVSTSQFRVRLFNLGQLEFEVPAGVGQAATPTPHGAFYVTMLAPGPNASYGAEVLALSAHSETIDNWAGSGDALTAIHGPIGADGAIKAGGGAFTNGCIRVLFEDLDRLLVVPPGTPVDIID